jgi:hypothetical protein
MRTEATFLSLLDSENCVVRLKEERERKKGKYRDENGSAELHRCSRSAEQPWK